MDVKAIVKRYLIEKKYDGLFYEGVCGCTIDDLEPCGDMQSRCQPGFKGPCTCGDGCDFHIYETPEDVERAKEEFDCTDEGDDDAY